MLVASRDTPRGAANEVRNRDWSETVVEVAPVANLAEIVRTPTLHSVVPQHREREGASGGDAPAIREPAHRAREVARVAGTIAELPVQVAAQLHTVPSANNAMVKLPPAAIIRAGPGRLVSAIGEDRSMVVPSPSIPSKLLPHAQTVPTESTANDSPPPAAIQVMPFSPGTWKGVG
jgi:hypothetical protein